MAPMQSVPSSFGHLGFLPPRGTKTIGKMGKTGKRAILTKSLKKKCHLSWAPD